MPKIQDSKIHGSERVDLRNSDGDIITVAVLKSKSDNTMVLSVEDAPTLEDGQSVIVNTYDELRGMTTYDGVVVLRTPSEVHIGSLKPLGSRNRRGSLKVPCDFEITIEKVLLGKLMVPAPEPIPVLVKDISTGGIFINTINEMRVGTKFEFSHAFNDVTRRDVGIEKILTEIIRKQPVDDKLYSFGYGCKFLNPTPKQADILSGIVMELHTKHIQKRNREREDV